MKPVTAEKNRVAIPTYVPNPPTPLPMFFEKKPYQGATGRLYPLPFSDGICDEKTDRTYDLYTLENEYIRTEVLPEIGGKIQRGFDKIGQYDFIYHNEVVKPALVGLAGPWISGGIEFNWPQHHRPTTFQPLQAKLTESENGEKTVWVGEIEPFHRMKGMTGVTVCPGRSFIKVQVRLFNRTPLPQVFLWWANFAAPANEQYRSVFPPDVEWVNDHDRRAVMSWPIARGVYHTARPFDYGDGTDISRYASVRVPSSFLVSQGQSDMDFLSGYDDGKNMGFVTIADHRISPGKKLWHWGKGDFGDMWCANLTDCNGPYVELMTGVYSDNQPDFTWIEPYGCRSFVQYWYPIRGIGSVKNATMDAAMNLEQRGTDGYLGLNVTGCFAGAHIRVTAKNQPVLDEYADLTPEQAYQATFPIGDCAETELCATLTDAAGRLLVAYTPVKRGEKKPIEVRKPVARPSELETVEELAVNGLHLEQYKQHNYDPRDYYLEGLRRDPGDIRCNTGMARICLRNGEFAQCVSYADAALDRLLSRNQHPMDTQPLYLRGVALSNLGRDADAYEAFARAGWNEPYRSAAYYELALLDCRKADALRALDDLRIAEEGNGHNADVQCLRAAVLRRMGRTAEARAAAQSVCAADPLNLWARLELLRLNPAEENEIREIFGDNPDVYLNAAGDYLRAGFYDDAYAALDFAGDGNPMTDYTRAYCLDRSDPDKARRIRSKAAATDPGLFFPNRLADITVLEVAIDADPADANARYLLGCLLYDRFRSDEAEALWEACIGCDPKYAKAYRNLALVYADKRRDYAGAKQCMEIALQLLPDEPRLLFEYQQLLRQMNVKPAQRLAVYDRYPKLLARRDDCRIDRMELLCMAGRYTDAIAQTDGHRFHIYEGGEGKLTKQHAWMYLLYGNQLREAGKIAEAAQAYRDGTRIPKAYGEAKTFFNQEAHLHYFLGTLLAENGRTDEARAAFADGAVYKAAVSELSLFRALCLRELARFSEARQVLTEMDSAADTLLRNCDRYSYYGVGSPSPMPFDSDIVRDNLRDGHILKAYAQYGLGHFTEAEAEICAAALQSPFDFRIYAYRCVTAQIGG